MEKKDRSRSPFWNKALERYRGELEEEDADEYQTILEAGTLEELVEQIKTIQPPNAKEKAVINRLDPILKFISDFSAVLAVCFGADAKLTALVWGSLRIILTLASTTGDTLRDVVDILEELSLTLPRFRYYERTLPIDDSFETALVDVYTEVICFYARTIHFYRSNPHGLLRRNAWAEFHGDFSKTIQRIKRLSSAVESEAEAARMRLDRSGYTEVLDLMKKMKESKLFWGREDALKSITETLEPIGGDDSLKSFALWGMGGVGKTQIALQYASSRRQRFDSVLWLSADNAIQVAQSFREIARRLELVITDEETEDAMAAMMKVKNWLVQAGHRWLIIFDNADDPEVIRHAWPHDARGSILLTTRNPSIAMGPAGGGFHVQPFNDTEGSDLLLRFIDLDSQSDSNRGSAMAIAHTLGGLPLALNQIGGFINQRKVPLKDFLPLYNRNATKINARKSGITDYEHSISTMWEMSLNKLSGPPRRLQEILSFFNPDKIEEVVLREGSQSMVQHRPELDFLADELDLLDAEEALLHNALINKSNDTSDISVHRLVQAAVTRRLSAQDRISNFDAVVKILCWGFPDTFSEDVGHQHRSWEKCENCLPHVDHVVKLKEQYDIQPSEPDGFAELLLRCCWYLYERESYEIARVWTKEALKNFSNDSTLAFASAIELLGLVDMDTNYQNDALKSFTRALEIRTRLLGSDDAFIAASLTTLGIVHTELGSLDKAYAYHQQAIDIRLRTKSDRIGNSYSNMSSLLLRIGRADEAEEVLKRCPSLKDFTDDTFLKTGNPRFSGDLVLLARIRERQGRLEEALRLASKALGFRQKLLGNGLKTCDSLHQVADLLQKRENLASATAMLNECVAVSKSLPEGDGQLARAFYKLSLIYGQQGKTKLSQEVAAEARATRNKILGKSDANGDESEEVYNQLNLWMLW